MNERIFALADWVVALGAWMVGDGPAPWKMPHTEVTTDADFEICGNCACPRGHNCHSPLFGCNGWLPTGRDWRASEEGK